MYSGYYGYGSYGYSTDIEDILEDVFGAMNEEGLLIVLGILGIVLLVLVGILLVVYLFTAIGMYKIGKNRGLSGAAMAFFPYFNSYFLGKVADDINAASGKETTHRHKMVAFVVTALVLALINGVVGFLFGFTGMVSLAIVLLFVECITFVVSICLSVYAYICLYAIYKEYAPDHAVLFLVLSIFLDISAFLIFAIRNKKGQTQLLREQQTQYAAPAGYVQ